MRRFFTLLLCLALALCLAAPAWAETAPEGEESQAMDAALEQVTLQVKQTLQIGDQYTTFYSDYYDGPAPRWSLTWADDTHELSVEAAMDGTVLDVRRWDKGGASDSFYGFDPAFPALSREQAQAQAEKWLGRLITGADRARVDSVRTVLGADGYYRFAGTVEKNALPSPESFTLAIDGQGLRSFSRSGGYVGALPAAKAQAPAEAAAQALADAVEMELYYVSDGEGAASLRYVPVGPYTAVDAQTGQAVDMDALYASFGGEGGLNGAVTMDAEAAEAPAMGAGGAALTETELASIANYTDAMDEKALDAALRALTALGLDGFEMQRCSYAMDSETGDVTASVRYTGVMTQAQLYGYDRDAFLRAEQEGADMTIYKYMTVDAKTGALESLSTRYPLWEKDETGGLGERALQRAAENFLKQAAPDKAAQAKRCTLSCCAGGSAMTFAQVHEGYFFPENSMTVEVNPGSGTVDSFSCTWDEDVSFGPAAGPVGLKQAAAAYAGALDVSLGYVAWPVDITLEDNAVYAAYLDWGYSYVEELRLAYYFDGLEQVEGVDALTGQAVTAPAQPDGTFVYSDLDRTAASARIEALGLAGVGFEGGLFLPGQMLTQRDAAALLLRADGSAVPEDDAELGRRAADEGFIPAAEWQPDGAVTRMGFLKMLLSPSRYGAAAKLTGAWEDGFTDVDAADAGYAAIARALGLVGGETLSPGETITRSQAAQALYAFMDR